MIREVVNVKHPALRKKSKKVGKIDKKIKSLIQDMKDTLLAQKDPEGVGLAAPQIGKNLQVFLMKPDDSIRVVINPKIKSISKQKVSTIKEKKILEGCLSLPHYYGPLQRPQSITLEFMDESGKIVTETFTGFNAQIVLHEIDHLEGVLFVDRLLEQGQPLYELDGDEWHEVDLV